MSSFATSQVPLDGAQVIPPIPKLEGYPKLAALMGTYGEAAIFRKFGSLNMWNLLSQQAEILELQVQLRDIWQEDSTSTDPTARQLCNYFLQLRKSKGSHNEIQLQMMITLREKLREYSAYFSLLFPL